MRSISTSKSAVKRYPSMRRAILLLYKMSSFESKVKPKFKQLCLVKKHEYAVWKYARCDLTSLVTLCLSFTVLCKAVKSLCVSPSSCLFSLLIIFGHLWQLQSLCKKIDIPKVIAFLWTSWGWVLAGEFLLRPWQCDSVLFWHHKNSTGELNYKCPISDNSFTGACSFLGTKVSQLQYSSLTVIRLY